MAIPAVFPIGKTQWRKWTDAQRGAFNRLRSDGVPHLTAIKQVNSGEAFAPALAKTEKTETVRTKTPPAPRKPRTKKA